MAKRSKNVKVGQTGTKRSPGVVRRRNTTQRALLQQATDQINVNQRRKKRK